MKTFLSIALAGVLATGLTTLSVADDTTTTPGTATPGTATPGTATPSQSETTPAAKKQAAEKTRRGEGRKGEAAAGDAKVGAAAPAFTLKTTDGKDWSLSDAKGKVVVLEWINPNCPVCVRVCESGVVADTLKGCKDAFEDVVYVTINSSAAQPDSLKATAEYLKSHKLDVPGLLDEDGKVGQMYGARTTPHCYVIDQNGVLVYQGAIDDSPSGGAKTNYVVNAVKQLKAGEKVSPSETKPYGCSVKYKKS